MKDLLRQPQPSLDEFGFLIVIVAIFTGLLIFTDISIHDSYVGKIIAECYPGNQDHFCKMMRDFMKLPSNAQMQLGDVYWFVLITQAVTISFVMFLIRLMMVKLAGEPISPMILFIAALWGFTTFAFYYFGFLDAGYYVLRQMEIPNELPWLNGLGIFTFTQHLGPTINVDKSDLFITMLLGTIIVVGLWALAIHHHKKGTLKKLGLIHR